MPLPTTEVLCHIVDKLSYGSFSDGMICRKALAQRPCIATMIPSAHTCLVSYSVTGSGALWMEVKYTFSQQIDACTPY
jgi:hypothetical protein